MKDFVKADELVGSRYRLTQKDTDQPRYAGASIWHGTDTTLHRAVRIIVLNPEAETFSEVLDAARRCSLFDDPHAVRILSVGSDERFGWIVTEVPLGVPVSYRLVGTPFPTDQAAAIVGETASILASARARGIRHLQLDPADVRLDSAGEVYLDGLAVEAAMAGIHTDSMLAYEADRIEARGLALLYSCLLTGESDDDPKARFEKLQNSPALSESLRFYFEKEAADQGPLSASDVIRALAPWPKIKLESLPYVPGTEPVEHDPKDIDPELGIAPPPRMQTNPMWPSTKAHLADVASFPPIGEDDVEDAALRQAGNGEAAGGTVSAAGGSRGSGAAAGSASGSGKGGAPASSAAAAAGPSGAAGQATEVLRTTGSEQDPRRKSNKKRGGDSARQMSASASGSKSKFASKPAQAARSSFEKQVDKVSVAPADGSPRRFKTSWLFTAVSLALVIVAGLWAFTLFLTPPDVEAVSQGPTGPMNRDISNLEKTEEQQEATLIASAALLDPQAPNVPTSDVAKQDNPDTIPNLIDDDTSTVWSSWWYPTPTYTYGKDGIGIVLKLKEPKALENVHLQVNGNGGKVQWRNTTEAEPAGGDVIAEGQMSTATYLVAPSPIQTDTIILWFPELPKDAAEKNRLTIAEINFNKPVPDALRTPPAQAAGQ